MKNKKVRLSEKVNRLTQQLTRGGKAVIGAEARKLGLGRNRGGHQIPS